jgi:DNA-binding NtrC family response regulator
MGGKARKKSRSAASGAGAGEALHPLVAKYIASVEPAGKLALEMPPPREPAVQAIADLSAVAEGRLPYAEVRAGLVKIDLNGCDPDLRLVLLNVWVQAANRSLYGATSEQVDEVRTLTRMARAMLSDRTPPELRVDVLSNEAFTSNVQGDMVAREKLLEEARRALPPGSPRYVQCALNYFWNLAIAGKLAPQRSGMEELRGRPELAVTLRLFELVDAVEAGRADEAAGLVAELGQPWEPVWSRQPQAKHLSAYRWLRAAAGFLRGDSSIEGACRATGLADPRDPEYAAPEMQAGRLPDWVPVWHHLLARRPQRALEHALTEVAEWGPTYDTALGSMTLDLARCELACGHVEAARQAIEKRRRLGNIRYLDGLFLARLALLTGDRDAAALHFAEAMSACERYRARGRLAFELRLACELSPIDLVWLGEAAAASAGSGRRRPGAAGPAAPVLAAAEARGGDRLVGSSRALAAVREAVLRLGPLDATVLITGETGTGKELAARAIHDVGPRSAEPFLAVNCGAITESLLESELFGHEKGAFTGATAAHRGLFEEAGAGSILLDEIGDIPPRLQVSLLRVLEAGEIRPVGASRPRRIACRVLAATHADLAALVEQGSFRSDLFYRLQRLQVHLPPLRERPDDILPLAAHFLAEGRQDGLRPVLKADARRWMLARQWPGNVRELRNAIERLRLMNSDKLEYGLEDLEACGSGASGAAPAPAAAGGQAEPGSAPRPAAAAEVDASPTALPASRSPMRQLDRLRAFFAQHGKLTRGEAMGLLDISHATASRYLKALCADGSVEKVTPSGSPRAHYWRRTGASSAGSRP